MKKHGKTGLKNTVFAKFRTPLQFDKTAAFSRNKTEEGTPASYIPDLVQTAPGLFSLSMTTLDGTACSCGDRDSFFSTQSISKAAALCFAIETLGRDRVFSKIGMEPCSELFNSMMKLEMTSSISLNPFINARAIVLAGMLNEQFQALAIAEVMDFSPSYGLAEPQQSAY